MERPLLVGFLMLAQAAVAAEPDMRECRILAADEWIAMGVVSLARCARYAEAAADPGDPQHAQFGSTSLMVLDGKHFQSEDGEQSWTAIQPFSPEATLFTLNSLHNARGPQSAAQPPTSWQSVQVSDVQASQRSPGAGFISDGNERGDFSALTDSIGISLRFSAALNDWTGEKPQLALNKTSVDEFSSGSLRSPAYSTPIDSDRVCTNALQAPLATVVPGASTRTNGRPSCLLGINCDYSDPESVIDDQPDTFAKIDISPAADDVSISLDVQSRRVFLGGDRVGFIVADPSGNSLALDVPGLARQITVETLLDGVVTGDSSRAPAALQLDSLGARYTGDQRVNPGLVSLVTTAGKPYNQLRLTFRGGSATDITSLRVYSACATATLTAPWGESRAEAARK